MFEDGFSWADFDVELRDFFFTTEDLFRVLAVGMTKITFLARGKEKTTRGVRSYLTIRSSIYQ